MNAIKKYVKHNPHPDVKKLRFGALFKNYNTRNKYMFNEFYKDKRIPKEELVFLVKRILNHKNKYGENEPDKKIKEIARGFVLDHHELFPDFVEVEEATDDEYEEDKPKIKNMEENDVKKHEENDVKKHEENDVKKHEEINTKLEELREDICKKFNDMIDSHLDLKKMIEEKRHISNEDAKSRLENMEGKIEMLYGKQMEEKKHKYVPKVKSKEDMLREYLYKKF